MKTNKTLETAYKALYLFDDLREMCYADGIDEFDALHDDLYYQSMGLYESINEAKEDLLNGNDLDAYKNEFNDALKLAKEVEQYRKQFMEFYKKNFNCIYC